MEVDTSSYQASWGRKPRGRGQWAFDMVVKGTRVMAWASGSYTEAKRKIVKLAVQNGAEKIIVLS